MPGDAMPGRMSSTSEVPAVVPSVTYNSVPVAGSSAMKNIRSPATVNARGFEPPLAAGAPCYNGRQCASRACNLGIVAEVTVPNGRCLPADDMRYCRSVALCPTRFLEYRGDAAGPLVEGFRCDDFLACGDRAMSDVAAMLGFACQPSDATRCGATAFECYFDPDEIDATEYQQLCGVLRQPGLIYALCASPD